MLNFCLYTVPSVPLDLAYTNESSISVRLTWTRPASPNGVIESYTLNITDLSVMPNQLDSQTITDSSGNLTEYLVMTGLLPFHTYKFVLTASTDRGPGNESTLLIVYTLEDCECVGGVVIVWEVDLC